MDALAGSRCLPAWIEAFAAALVESGDDVNGLVQEALRRVEPLMSGEPAAAAVLIALVEMVDDTGVLFIRRRDDIATHPGQVAFPGGAREGAENAAETALREAEEETALPPDHVHILGRLPDYPTTTGYRVAPVVGYVPELPRLHAQPEEVAEIFIVPLEALLDSGQWRDHPLNVNGQRLPHRELYWQGQRIWGATAGMFRMLLPALTQAREARS